MGQSNVSVIVVSYNTKEKLRRCLAAIEPEHEVIVVDNTSSDGSAEMVAASFPSVVLIRNVENRGFGAANNQGLDVATRPLVLYLNSDCYAFPGAISLLASCFDDAAVVAAGGKLLNPDGSLQESVARSLTLWAVFSEQMLLEKLPFTRTYWCTREMVAKGLRECEQVTGAALMAQRLERFDERFFLYCEDTDLCFRLRKHGTIVFEPSASFTHDLGSSSTGVGRWKSVARYNRGKELYFSIHRGGFASFVCWLFDRLGALLRLVVWLVPCLLTLGIVKRFRDQVGLFARVLTSPILGPDRGLRTPR